MGFLHGEPPQDSLLASGSPRESPSSLTPGLAARGRRRGGTAPRGGEGLDVITRPAANLATGRRTDRLPRVSRRGTDYLRNSIRFEFSFRRNVQARIAGAATSFARRSRCLTSQPDRGGPNSCCRTGTTNPCRAVAWRQNVLRDASCRDHRAVPTLRFLWSIEANWLAACDPSVDEERGSNTKSTG